MRGGRFWRTDGRWRIGRAGRYGRHGDSRRVRNRRHGRLERRRGRNDRCLRQCRRRRGRLLGRRHDRQRRHPSHRRLGWRRQGRRRRDVFSWRERRRRRGDDGNRRREGRDRTGIRRCVGRRRIGRPRERAHHVRVRRVLEDRHVDGVHRQCDGHRQRRQRLPDVGGLRRRVQREGVELPDVATDEGPGHPAPVRQGRLQLRVGTDSDRRQRLRDGSVLAERERPATRR